MAHDLDQKRFEKAIIAESVADWRLLQIEKGKAWCALKNALSPWSKRIAVDADAVLAKCFGKMLDKFFFLLPPKAGEDSLVRMFRLLIERWEKMGDWPPGPELLKWSPTLEDKTHGT